MVKVENLAVERVESQGGEVVTVERVARAADPLASLVRVVVESLVRVVDQVRHLVVGNHQGVDHTHLDLDGQDLDQVVVTTVRSHTTVYPRIGIHPVRILQVRILGMPLPSHRHGSLRLARMMDGSLHSVRTMEVDGVDITPLLPPLMMIGVPVDTVASLGHPVTTTTVDGDHIVRVLAVKVARAAGPLASLERVAVVQSLARAVVHPLLIHGIHRIRGMMHGDTAHHQVQAAARVARAGDN